MLKSACLRRARIRCFQQKNCLAENTPFSQHFAISLIFNHIHKNTTSFRPNCLGVWAERSKRLGRTLSGFCPNGKAKHGILPWKIYGLTTGKIRNGDWSAVFLRKHVYKAVGFCAFKLIALQNVKFRRVKFLPGENELLLIPAMPRHCFIAAVTIISTAATAIYVKTLTIIDFHAVTRTF